MELTEICASNRSPYRCYVRGGPLISEGDNVHTVGFKDGISVVEYRPDKTDNRDKDKLIDLTKLKKIIVTTDPDTGKKYILKDGKRIEIIPQVKPPPLINVKNRLRIKSISHPQKDFMLETQAKRNQETDRIKDMLSKNPDLIKTKDNVKYHVFSVNVKKTPNGRSSVGTMTNLLRTFDKNPQTDCLNRREVCTQTDCSFDNERLVEGGSPFGTGLWEFLNSDIDLREKSPPKNMIDPIKLNTKEQIDKFNFFNDLRMARTFDRSGNLPIHDSVVQDNLPKVRKNCVVLKALKESVDILNQQSFAPLHLAVLYNVNVEILKTLLQYGADLSATDPVGNTALHLAVENKRASHLEILLKTDPVYFSINCFNHDGFTPLIIACLNEDMNIAKMLLDKGANPNEKDMKSGRTALFHAAESHNVEMVKLMLQYKADTKIRNFFGTSPHDAMFELEEMPLPIKFCILGRDYQKSLNRKKIDAPKERQPPTKKARLEVRSVLMKVDQNDFIKKTT